ncbi:CAP domain-containing protein [Streptomyces sp. ZAF1911]|uniref:CAP domain-containing protein n=1 Tax=Streptomyces sp. ZAF1911 TaxID=2944129 RepID=UPI00237BBB40|nr:CAP domain-containing protein [Streptomyces sp. ZAF1911]MDD9379152.1 CAP domain-containing protein [Streptomyces sp. ZAF1911]
MGRHRLHAAPRPGGKRRAALRGGLLGASVAVVLGTAAVTTGFVPVGSSFPYVGVETAGSGAKSSQAGAKASPSPGSALEQQGGLANLSGRAPSGASTPSSPAPSAPPSPSASPSPSPSPSTEPAKTPAASPTPAPVKPKPSAPKTSAPAAPAAPPASAGHSAEEAAVLTLVNQERAQAGCGPVRANPPLAALAGAFSKDMAVRGFFDHTDPDGNTPWDRATKAGISGMGGENIARGQGDAAAVMKAWMNSPGHKANILNCEFRTLGVGVYNAAGGPWWTQDFGF